VGNPASAFCTCRVVGLSYTEARRHHAPHPSPQAQVRGSIPLLWSQAPCLKYKIPIRIAPPSRYQPVFEAHAQDLAQGYQVGA
jgi:hypothetical protein